MNRYQVLSLAAGALWLAGATARADLLPPMNGYASDFAERRTGSAVGAKIKISTTRQGLHRVTGADLVAAGVSTSKLAGDQLRLFNRTAEVAISVSTNGVFGPQDYFVFYAEEYESVDTRHNVYWLGFGAGGQRFADRDASPISGGVTVDSYQHHTRHSPENFFAAGYEPTNVGLDHWFAAFMSKPVCLYNTFDLWTRDRLGSGTAVMRLRLCGGNIEAGADPDHRTTVQVNGTDVGDLEFDGMGEYTGEVSFASILLATNSTPVVLTQTQVGATYDRAYLVSLGLSFPRALRLSEDAALVWDGQVGACNYVVSSASGGAPAPFRIADCTNPLQPVWLTNSESTNGSRSVVFGDTSAVAHQYVCVDSNSLITPESIERVFFRDLCDTSRQADYLLICPYAFRASAYRLLRHRHLEGLTVAVAPIEDIYNEFSYGIEESGAIKQFLGYAFHHWQTPVPQYVLVAGKGSYDPKGNEWSADQHVIPVHMDASSWRWTAMDNWFVQVSGSDQLPDMALGRIPVADDAALGQVVDKIIGFEAALAAGGAWTNRATLVADDDPSGVFRLASENRVAPHLATAGFGLSKVYMDVFPYSGSPSTVRSAILSGFNSGRSLFTFFGHGAIDFWTDEQVWRDLDVDGLSNAIQPIVAMFTCQTAYYHDPSMDCIAERLLLHPSGGAAGCIGPTILADEAYSEYVADGFASGMVASGGVRFGDAWLSGLTELFVSGNPYREELRAYLILGDPAMRVKP